MGICSIPTKSGFLWFDGQGHRSKVKATNKKMWFPWFSDLIDVKWCMVIPGHVHQSWHHGVTILSHGMSWMSAGERTEEFPSQEVRERQHFHFRRYQCNVCNVSQYPWYHICTANDDILHHYNSILASNLVQTVWCSHKEQKVASSDSGLSVHCLNHCYTIPMGT